MFGFFKRTKSVVRAHWYVPIADYETSVEDFYASIETEIKGRGFPGVEVSRLVFKVGGMLSSGREYLRIRRERILFDTGCGPFGNCWYYSCRGCILPRRMRLWEILVALATIGSFAMLYVLSFGLMIGLCVLGGTLIAIGALLMQAGKWPGLDDFLLNLPVVGGIYELFFRPETYHRQDTRHVFIDMVNHFIREKVKEDALGRGREDLKFVEVKDVEQPMGYKDLASDVLQQLMDDVKENPVTRRHA
jgi:hypothetical protein